MSGQPIAFGFRLKEMDRRSHADEVKSRLQPKRQSRIPIGSPLVQPADGRAQRSVCFIEANVDTALGRQGHRGDSRPQFRPHQPEVPAGLTKLVPKILAILLCPTGLAREIRLDVNLRFGEQLTLQIENHRPNALRSLVDGQDEVSHGVWLFLESCWWMHSRTDARRDDAQLGPAK